MVRQQSSAMSGISPRTFHTSSGASASAPQRPVRVALVDGHSFLRAGIIALLAEFDDIEIVASVSSVEELDAHTGVLPDVVVCELNLPGVTGPEAVAHLRALGYQVLLVTAETDQTRLLAGLDAGACGFIGKSGDGGMLRANIRAAAAREDPVNPRVVERMREQAEQAALLVFPPALETVLRLLAEGLDNQTIAARRGVGVSTVKKQVGDVREVFRRAGWPVDDRADLREAARDVLGGRTSPRPRPGSPDGRRPGRTKGIDGVT
jgi:DNA-binding NarL/FixJ family response regulator